MSGALCQHQVTQEITQPAPERQIRLDDIERDGLKSAPAAYQQPSQTYQQQAQAYQQQQPAAFQQAPQAYQQVALPTQQQAVHHIYHPQYQLAPSGTAYQTQQVGVVWKSYWMFQRPLIPKENNFFHFYHSKIYDEIFKLSYIHWIVYCFAPYLFWNSK